MKTPDGQTDRFPSWKGYKNNLGMQMYFNY